MQNNQLNNMDLTAELVESLIKEKRSERLWKNIRFFMVLLVVAIIGWNVFRDTSATREMDGAGQKRLCGIDTFGRHDCA